MASDTDHVAKAAIKNIQPCKSSSGDHAYTGTKRRSAAKPPPGNLSYDQGEGFDPNMLTFTYLAGACKLSQGSVRSSSLWSRFAHRCTRLSLRTMKTQPHSRVQDWRVPCCKDTPG